MTALSLARIVADELGRVGEGVAPATRDRARRTVFAVDLPGFGVRHHASGRRTYVVQCRMAGRMRTVTLGDADVLRERTARDVARRILLRVEVGENPAETKARARAVPSFAQFLAEYWTRMSPHWKATTRYSQASYRERHLQAAFTGMFVDEIGQGHVARWFAEITRSTGPGAANRALDILKSMMRKAEDWGYREAGVNPCDGIRRNRQRRCERFLSEAELARLGVALERLRSEDPLRVAAVTLILLTGCRRTEIADLRWTEVKGRRLSLHDSKTGPRTVWLGREARAVLDRVPRQRGAEYVFPAGNAKRTSLLDVFWRQVRDEAGLSDVRLHDLRHSYASFAARQSQPLPVIGKLLGHAKVGSTARYTHLDDDSLVQSAERLGQLIQGKLC